MYLRNFITDLYHLTAYGATLW